MQIPPWVRDCAFERRRGHRSWRGQVDLRRRVSHPALEVPVGRGDAPLACGHDALVRPEAGPAAGVYDDSTGGDVSGQNPLLARLDVDRS